MYIEFDLAPTNTRPNALFANSLVTQALHDWSDRYNIPYNVKNHKYIKRVTFDDDRHYTLFAMTWNAGQTYHLSRWRIVSDLNNKTKFNSVL
jgi:hypothetical protein